MYKVSNGILTSRLAVHLIESLPTFLLVIHQTWGFEYTSKYLGCICMHATASSRLLKRLSLDSNFGLADKLTPWFPS